MYAPSKTIELYIGIDPGLSGAIACLDANQTVVCLNDMIVTDNNKNVGVYRTLLSTGIRSYVKSLTDAFPGSTVVVHSVIEKLGPQPLFGGSGNFRMGSAYGAALCFPDMLDMMLSCNCIAEGIPASVNTSTELVHATKWKAQFFLSKASKQDSLDYARRMFPTESEKLSYKKDHNRAEALLIAEYCRRMYR